MKYVILEDELPAANRLKKMIAEQMPEAALAAQLDSVKAGAEWFSSNPAPDLVFMDIHLSDGSAFDLLQRVSIQAPIIFVTAYDQYAVEAFKANSIDYLMKPVKAEDLSAAISKLNRMGELLTPGDGQHDAPKQAYKKRFLIRFGEHIKTINTEDIAYCYSESKSTFARTTDGRTHPLDYNLDTLDTILDPQDFFRINRQYLISLRAIEEMKTYTKARVIIRLQPPAKENPVVSSERAADFKKWLAGE